MVSEQGLKQLQFPAQKLLQLQAVSTRAQLADL